MTLNFRNPYVVNPLEWFGLNKVDQNNGGSFVHEVRGWLSIIITLLMERVIVRRSRYLQSMSSTPENVPGAIFPDITRVHVDETISGCCKFFANYFFHKFGCEGRIIHFVQV